MSRSKAAAGAGVPFIDLQRIHRQIEAEIRSALADVVARGDFILGEQVSRFEQEFAAYVGVAEAIGVNSGTSALAIAIRACGVRPGDEVLVPAHTYVASALAVVHAGATPIFCDVAEDTGLIDLESAEALVGERTAAIMPVHLYGQACEMPALLAFAGARGLAVIEDAAQAHGASWDGRRVGSFGVAAGFSFYPSKNLGAFGDGGIVCTDDPEVATAARRLRNLGQLRKGDHELAGCNDRLDTVQAAVLRVKLSRLDEWNEDRARSASLYRRELPPRAPTLPARDRARDVHHLLPVRVSDRDAVREVLRTRGIETGVHYSPPVHRQPVFAAVEQPASLERAERWAAEELSLPMFAGLTPDEVGEVCRRLGEAL